MHTPPISPDRYAALRDTAKERAHELRREAIAALITQSGRWLADQTRRLLPARRRTPCHP